MNSFARSLWSGLAIVVVACSVAIGQTNPSPGTNACIIPVPRTDERGTNRYIQLRQRVKDCQGKADVIFLGDSITQAWEVEGKEVWAKYYLPRHALNLGMGSDRTQHVLWRLDHGHLADLKPKVVVLLIGVNNIPDDSYTPGMVLEGVTAVVQKLRTKLPETKILLLGIFPFHEDFHPQRAKALQVNQALHKLDDGKGVHFLDFGYLFIQPDGKISKDMMPDFVHLTPTGYQLWAEAMEAKLAKLLGDQPVKP
jgi:lysophospholipase L1-like esterase